MIQIMYSCMYLRKTEGRQWLSAINKQLLIIILYTVHFTVPMDYYMTSDNVFSDWLMSLVTFFDKMLY
jgi:hypothetical protein